MIVSKTYVLTSEQVLGCLLRGVALVGLVPEPTVDQAFDTIEQGLGEGATVAFVANGAVLTFAHDNAPMANEDPLKDFIKKVQSLPPDQFMAISVRAGIHSEDGSLTERYGGSVQKRPRKSRKSAHTPTTDPTDDTIKVLDFEDEDGGDDPEEIPT